MTLDPDVNDRKFEYRDGPTGATIATWRDQLELIYRFRWSVALFWVYSFLHNGKRVHNFMQKFWKLFKMKTIKCFFKRLVAWPGWGRFYYRVPRLKSPNMDTAFRLCHRLCIEAGCAMPMATYADRKRAHYITAHIYEPPFWQLYHIWNWRCGPRRHGQVSTLSAYGKAQAATYALKINIHCI
jgi:hypothetical protein